MPSAPTSTHRRLLLIAVLAVSVAIATDMPSAHPSIQNHLSAPHGYPKDRLIWSESFPRGTLDSSRWNDYMTSIAAKGMPWNPYSANGLVGSALSPPDSYNAEVDSPSSVRVAGGLALTAHPGSPVSGYGYTGSVVDTYGKFSWSRGYFQALVRMPDVSKGYWPAIWFLPAAGANTGADRGEFDLDEGGFLGSGPDNQRITSTLVSAGGEVQHKADAGVDLSRGFYVYGARYIPGRSLTVYFNGRQVARFTRHVPTWPLQLIIDLAVASTRARAWHTTGSPPPSAMYVSEIQFYN